MPGTARLIQKSCSIIGLPLICFRSFVKCRLQPTGKGAAARLAGVEVPKHDDTEKTFADLKSRLAKTVAFVQSLKPTDIDGSEGREINLTLGEHTMSFKGQPYLVHFVMPNFYFHCTTAYDILRHCGVELGKRDFIGSI
jgi:uncharacterized protein